MGGQGSACPVTFNEKYCCCHGQTSSGFGRERYGIPRGPIVRIMHMVHVVTARIVEPTNDAPKELSSHTHPAGVHRVSGQGEGLPNRCSILSGVRPPPRSSGKRIIPDTFQGDFQIFRVCGPEFGICSPRFGNFGCLETPFDSGCSIICDSNCAIHFFSILV